MKIEILPITGDKIGVVVRHHGVPSILAEAANADDAMFFARGMQAGHDIARSQMDRLVIAPISPAMTATATIAPPLPVSNDMNDAVVAITFLAKVAAMHIPDDDFAFASDAERDSYIEELADGDYASDLYKIVREARAAK